MKQTCYSAIFVIACSALAFGSCAQTAKPTHYLFTYFTGNAKADESIHFAISKDGMNFRALNNNQPVISSAQIGSTGGVRDPHILRGADGKTFYMVVTDMVSGNGWNSNRAMVLLRSNDLVNWESHVVNIQQRFAGNDSLLRVWAPQTIYDPQAKKYMVYWSMKHGIKDNDKIYYAYANADFSDLETTPKQLFFKPDGGACIDGDIVYKNGKYHLFFKTEGSGSGIKIAVSDSLTGGYVLHDKYVQQTKDPVEGAGVFKLNEGDDYVLMYDVYTKGKYQFTRTSDLEHFKVIDADINMNFHPRHGTVMPITTAEAERLMRKWGTPEVAITNTTSAYVKKINVSLDTLNRKLVIPVVPGTALKNFDPVFDALPATAISPKGKQDFSKGPVSYSVNVGDARAIYSVAVKENHNPVLQGYFADPDIIFSEQYKKFFLYPTSDGFNNWSGTYFKTFSSADLVNWKDEGAILDLDKDVSWAKRNAWAPAIIERKTGERYRYYLYFCAEQKIGVAVADHPAGPFVDAGKPLIDARPDGGKGGQQIDPMVFHDPVSGKYFLYWGNGYMAGAELNEDMVSLEPGTTKILTPDASFREGVYVFYREGKYYFMWSQDDTRSENYRVRYGTGSSPLSTIQLPTDNLVIAKDSTAGIYGTGHNSVIQVPGKDEWYIVYHRFNYPQGITMGRAAGYNREICIDRLRFNTDGTIQRVIPTHEGVSPVHFAK